mgnify:CR=1 FL=1
MYSSQLLKPTLVLMRTFKSLWTHRPQFRHLAGFFGAYVLGCGFAQLLAIVPGTGISVWLPSGLFMATLVLSPRTSWPWWILAGFLAELVGNVVWFNNPLAAAVLIFGGNALEALVGAWLVNRACGRPVRQDTLQEVLAFVVLGACVAPLISATIGAATVSLVIQSQGFRGAWPLFWIGDATGVLIVAPLAVAIIQNWGRDAHLSRARWIEAIVLALIFLGIAALSLGGSLPFAFIIMPPLLWAAVRFEFKGAAVMLALLALVTAVFTVSGASQFAGDSESQRHKQIMLQLFLAISAFSALVVAAISRQHQLALITLRQSEGSLRDLLRTLPIQIWCTNPEGKPIYFSQQLQEFLGFDVGDKDATGTPRLSSVLTAIVHPDDLDAVSAGLANSFRTGEPFALKHRQRRHDGQYRWFETRATAMRNSDRAIVQWNGVCFDIDEQVRAEDSLRGASDKLSHAAQLASLAELSASIAHEVNQPLAAIIANSHACRRWLRGGAPNIERAMTTVERITRDANSAADVVVRVRALFRRAPQARSYESINSLIIEVCRLLADKTASQGIRIETQLEAALPSTSVDRVQVQQLLVNLIRNGIEAMESSGADSRSIHVRSCRAGTDSLRVEVRDFGSGFRDLESAFSPFVTTKPNGMGMGLAICRSIIEAHGGRLWASNNEAGGATVTFTLPLTA